MPLERRLRGKDRMGWRRVSMRMRVARGNARTMSTVNGPHYPMEVASELRGEFEGDISEHSKA